MHLSWIRGLCRRLCRRDDRLTDRIRQAITETTQWVASKPNAPETWQRVVDEVSDFLTGLWRQGELVGKQADEAFFVRCDRSVMTQDDIDNGRLIIEVGVAPTKPAEFVIVRIGLFTSEARHCGPDGAR